MCLIEWLLLEEKYKPEEKMLLRLVGLYFELLKSPKTSTQLGLFQPSQHSNPFAVKWGTFHQKAFYNRPNWLRVIPPYTNSSDSMTPKNPFTAAQTAFDYSNFYFQKLQGLLCHTLVKDSPHAAAIGRWVIDQLQAEDIPDSFSLRLLCLPLVDQYQFSLQMLMF